MTLETANFILQIFASIAAAAATGIGVYAGIKSDIASTKVQVKQAHETANEAHRRIDNLLLKD